jgi:hypothetical protein
MATASFRIFPLAEADESVEAIMVTDEGGLVKQKMNAALRYLSVTAKRRQIQSAVALLSKLAYNQRDGISISAKAVAKDRLRPRRQVRIQLC